MLTDKEIETQLEYNRQATIINEAYPIPPIDEPYEILDQMEKCRKALTTDVFRLCADCLDSSLMDTQNPPIYVSTSSRGQCEGYECKSGQDLRFLAHYSTLI